MRIALAQINPGLGQFENNKQIILNNIHRAKEKHCDLVIFPECALFGYHPFDLLEQSFLVDQQLQKLTDIERKIPKGIKALIGVISKNHSKKGRPYFNSAALVEKDKKTKFFHKQLLPTGDVFDEGRFIEPGQISKNVFSMKGHKVQVTICEDIWAWPDKEGRSLYSLNPIRQVSNKNIDLVVNISASPFYPEKLEVRKNLCRLTAKHFKAPMVYCNMVGAQDEVIYDGSSFAISSAGKLLMQSFRFEEDLNVLDLDKMQGGIRDINLMESDLIRRALVLGIRDFCHKVGIENVHLGLSGGIDSAVVACLAVEALGAGQVTGFALPGPYSSPQSEVLAKKLAQNLNIQFKSMDVLPAYQVLKKQIDDVFQINNFGLVHENLQSRLRGLLLMSWSNFSGSMLLNTSNKSEFAAGYSTLYGDLCGGLSPIGDLTKEDVYQLANLYNSQMELIPTEIIHRPPTAELRENQKDSDSLPAYDQLDKAVENIVQKAARPKSKAEMWLYPVLMRTEFKRWQSPPILKVSSHAFGRGRRFPIAAKVSNKL